MPKAASICLNADLDEALTLLLADGLDPQHGRVGVGPDHRDRVAGLSSVLIESSKRFFFFFFVVSMHTFHCLPMAKATRVVVLRVKK